MKTLRRMNIAAAVAFVALVGLGSVVSGAAYAADYTSILDDQIASLDAADVRGGSFDGGRSASW